MNISAKLKVSASKSATSPSCKTLGVSLVERKNTRQNNSTTKRIIATAERNIATAKRIIATAERNIATAKRNIATAERNIATAKKENRTPNSCF